MNPKDQSGFITILVELIIATAVLGLLGFIGWRLYSQPIRQTNHTTAKSQNNSTQSSKPSTPTPTPVISNYTDLQLANGKVSFQIPKDWIVSKNAPSESQTGNIRPSVALTEPTCMDYAGLTPPDKPTTIYGGGTEFFTVYLFVCPLPSSQTIKDWFENDYGMGIPAGSDQSNSNSINGYNTYYFEQINNSYKEMYYSFGASGKAVLITARVWEVSYTGDNGQIDNTMDVTRYIPAIQQIANSVQITP